MPTVIIPPTDVSPNTGTGSEVLSNSPTLVTPNIGAATGTSLALTGNVTASDLILGTSGPSSKSSINARAARQGLVFDGTAGAAVTISAFGTADFTVAIWLRLNSAQAHTFCDANNGLLIDAAADGSFRIYNRAASSQIYGAPASTLTTNKNYLLCYSRSGSGAVYLDGVALQTGISDSVSYTASISAIGSNYAGNYPINGFLAPFIYNRALSAAEVVSLFEAGMPAAADYGASGTPASNTSLVTGDNSTFASNTGFWALGNGATISGGKCNLTGGGNANLAKASLCSSGKKFRVTFTISVADNSLYITDYGVNVLYSSITGTGTKTLEFTGGPQGGFQIVSPNGTAVIDDLTLYPIGLLLAPDAGQAGGGLTWYDTSGNAANITLPASGVAWAVPTSGKTATSLNVNAAASLFASTSNSTSISDVDTTAALISKGSGTPRLYLGNDNTANRPFLQAGVGGGALFMTLQPYGGNVLLGSLTDNANGKLQLATHTTSAGGIGFGPDISLYRASANDLVVGRTAHKSLFFYADGTNAGIFTSAGSAGCGFYSNNSSLVFTSSGTTALTLDSSQRCILAGALRLNNAYTAGAPTATGYVTIQDSAGNTYKVLVGT